VDIKIPNNEIKGSRANNGYLPLTRDADPVHPSNEPGAAGDRRAGSMPLAGQASPIQPPNHRFAVGSSKMPQPPAATEPGKGSVPINPWDSMGMPNRASAQPDEAPVPRMPRR
jgi:hypothetical protein